MEISPRPFGDILNDGMALLSKVWRRLFAPAFWAFLVLGGLSILTFELTDVRGLLQQIITDPQSVQEMSETETLDRLTQVGIALSVAAVLQLVATGFVNLAVHRIVAAEIGGNPITSTEATTWALRRFPVMLLAGLASMLFVVLGLVAFVIPGIWAAGSLTMLTPVVALEGVAPTAAIRRSFELVRGRWFPTVGFMVLVGLVGSVAVQLVQLLALPVLALGGMGLGAGLGFVVLMVAQGMVVAAIAVMSTRWYLDLRARKEPLTTTSLI